MAASLYPPRQISLAALLLLTLLALIGLSLLSGSGQLGMQASLNYLMGQDSVNPAVQDQLAMVIHDLRLPRTLAGVMVGASLGVAGALLQSATRNPLADTGLLGVNAGAALGIVIGFTLGAVQSSLDYLLWAFIGALIANMLVLLIAQSGPNAASPLRLVLAGLALGATFSGATSYILLSHANAYEQYRFWILGTLAGASPAMIWPLVPAFLLGLAAAFVIVRPLSALLLGDDSARALGYQPTLIRMLVGVITTLLSGLAVALAGPLAFLGLIAPYLARSLSGARLFNQVLCSALLGAIVLVVADIVARWLSQPYDNPVSIILALIGAPLLIVLVRSNRLVA
ncbi:iron ABC transporter permease [Chitinibacter sp. SCUT-21]|uniref:FecCD family ABC transporter permease n=1 Tax=Chitinibacter sp. SCUT-21 TaxID=2970891 RepID=UPI0035A66B93